ncbi:hypothetical protein DPSP01_013738 [Paraphaeosphaeria sporulosa]
MKGIVSADWMMCRRFIRTRNGRGAFRSKPISSRWSLSQQCHMQIRQTLLQVRSLNNFEGGQARSCSTSCQKSLEHNMQDQLPLSKAPSRHLHVVGLSTLLITPRASGGPIQCLTNRPVPQ